MRSSRVHTRRAVSRIGIDVVNVHARRQADSSPLARNDKTRLARRAFRHTANSAITSLSATTRAGASCTSLVKVEANAPTNGRANRSMPSS